jgi:hypothetical protein
MIPASALFDQSMLTKLIEHDALVQRYRAFFSLFEWNVLPERDPSRDWPGPIPHPESSYIKAFLVKFCEGKTYITDLRRFLLEHPLLVLELGFRPLLDPHAPFGFDVARTVPCDRWLRTKLHTLDSFALRDLFHATVRALQDAIPGLGETIAIDVKHIYAWVKENNPRVSMEYRFSKERRPSDPDCRAGVKTCTNKEQADGSKKGRKEYLWGYGSGVVAAFTPDYGDVVLAEYTQPFNETDITYFRPLYQRAVLGLGCYPHSLTADAAYDAWYVYQAAALQGGIAAVPLNHHSQAHCDADGVPRCPIGLRMQSTSRFLHTNGYRAERYRCPLLHPEHTGKTCQHEQFAKGKGCVKDLNAEPGGRMRLTLDRHGPLYHAIFSQRTSCERINSQAKALGIERPKVRRRRAIENLNTLIYLIINAKALQRVRSINTTLLSSFGVWG